VLVTHNVLEAESVLDRVAVLDRGRVIACDTPGRLKAAVSDEVRLDLVWRAEPPLDVPAVAALVEHAEQVGRRWSARLPTAEARDALAQLTTGPAFAALDDFTLPRRPSRTSTWRSAVASTTWSASDCDAARPATPFAEAYRAVYAGQLARARVARARCCSSRASSRSGSSCCCAESSAAGPGPSSSSSSRVRPCSSSRSSRSTCWRSAVGYLKASGALDYYAALPVPPAAVVLGIAAAYASFAVPGTLVTALVGALLYDLSFTHLWVVLPAVVLAGAALSGLGAALGLALPRPELATVAGSSA
jgi:hypothetical protein